MNVILLDNFENLGGIGDLVTVKPGYGRNYLLPQGKAALATKEAERAALDEALAAKEGERAALDAALQTRLREINGEEIDTPEKLRQMAEAPSRWWRFTVERDGKLLRQMLRY